MQAQKEAFDERGVRVVVVSFAQPDRLAGYQAQHQWPFVVLADPERKAYQAFGLRQLSWLRVFSPATLKLYWSLLRKGRKLRSYGQDDYYQGGGDFVLDREGNLLFSHPSRDPSDRPSAKCLLEAVERSKTSAR